MSSSIARHLRYRGAGENIQRRVLSDFVRANDRLMDILQQLRATDLPQAMISGGAVYQTVWNGLTGRPSWHGIKDIDIIYHDDADLSWEGEDRVIRNLADTLGEVPVPVEVRNQARVHLWYRARFGHDVPALTSSAESLTRYSALTHAVAVWLGADDSLKIEAPFGLEDLFAFRIRPNPRNHVAASYVEKGERAKVNWPEVTVEPWPE